jgi:phosphoglycolate phosphatase
VPKDDEPVLFDLDGVLVDSRTPFARSLNAALQHGGLPLREEAELHAFIGPPIHETFRQLTGAEDVDAFVDAYRARYRAKMDEETTVMPGIPALLEALRGRALVVATSKPKALADPLLESLGLRGHFLAVEGPALAARAESKATTIGRALQALPPGARPLMVGDRLHDVHGAAAHGLDCVGVLWGIGSEAELREAGAVRIVATPEALLAALQRAA